MAKKSNLKLENIELQPQIIGHTYKKKNNVGRTIFVIAIFVISVIYIDNITLFINNLLGIQTSENIKDSANNNSSNFQDKDDNASLETIKEFNNNITFNNNNLNFNNFQYLNGNLSFDVNNSTNHEIDMTNKKIYLEIYDNINNKQLIDTIKLDIKTLKSNSKISFNFEMTKFNAISINEKTINDYPEVSLTPNSLGISVLSCSKDFDKIDYTFDGNKLTSIKHNYSYNLVNNSNYQTELNKYQQIISNYQNMSGIEASFSTSEYGFTALLIIDLEKVNLQNLNNKYYYGYKELAKVVNFEMTSFGFVCR